MCCPFWVARYAYIFYCSKRAYRVVTPTLRRAPLVGRIRGNNGFVFIGGRLKPVLRPTFWLKIGMLFWWV